MGICEPMLTSMTPGSTRGFECYPVLLPVSFLQPLSLYRFQELSLFRFTAVLYSRCILNLRTFGNHGMDTDGSFHASSVQFGTNTADTTAVPPGYSRSNETSDSGTLTER